MSSTLWVLAQRAQLFRDIREFFARRDVLEVETPLLSTASIPSPQLHSISARLGTDTHYLQTSPEFAMKRLLSQGSGSIYQLCKAFRDEEVGRYHRPEFTMLEWYRVGYDHHRLMDEMDDFLHVLLDTQAAERLTYRDVFHRTLDVDPFDCAVDSLGDCATRQGITFDASDENRDVWLNLLFSACIEPNLGQGNPTFIYDYPATQAALAQLDPGNPAIAQRFEVYVDGVELANGFHELTDPTEQRQRFEAECATRKAQNLPAIPLDEDFLHALTQGLPTCAGVALGVDRLLMLRLGVDEIQNVLPLDPTFNPRS